MKAELRPVHHCRLRTVIKPRFSSFEAGDDRVAGLPSVLARGNYRRSDVTTLRTPPEMHPPSIRGGKTFNTASSTWLGVQVDSWCRFHDVSF